MDNGAKTTERLVIISAIILGIVIVFVIGYSLYVRATRAEGELANKVELERITKSDNKSASISLTGESGRESNFTYDGLIQRRQEEATTTNFDIVDEKTPVEVPVEPVEEPLPPEVEIVEQATSTVPITTNDDDRALTEEEIRAIRQLPLDDSPSADLQTTLEKESEGQYKARY